MILTSSLIHVKVEAIISDVRQIEQRLAVKVSTERCQVATSRQTRVRRQVRHLTLLVTTTGVVLDADSGAFTGGC